MSQQQWKKAIRDNIDVPEYIKVCASACLYDLMNGPSFTRIPYGNVRNVTDDDYATYYDDLVDECVPECGDRIEETYTGSVGDAVRDFIADLPSECWVDTDYDGFMLHEPDAYEEIEKLDDEGNVVLDDNGQPETEMVECYMDSIWHIEAREIVEALFGMTFAREFT